MWNAETMQSRNIVHQASLSARRAVLIALLGATVLVACLMAKQAVFRYLGELRLKEIVAAHQAVDVINVGQERLANAATRATETGDTYWVDHYTSVLPSVDRAFREAEQIADPKADAAFHAKTRVSNQKRVALEQKALDHVLRGEIAEARVVLADPTYLYNKRVVVEGLNEFTQAVLSSADRNRERLESYERIALAMVFPIALAAGIALWRHLNASLYKSESAHLAAEEQIQGLALNDTLTGLANRTSIREALQTSLMRAYSCKAKVALLMIDLDRFKPVNDRHGHLVGDLVLKEIGRRLLNATEFTAKFGRFGGDEFVAIVEFEGDDEVPREVGRRIVSLISEPMTLQGYTVEVGASVGLAVYPTDAMQDHDLMGKADLALYKAKTGGRGSVRWFDASMDIDLQKRAELEAALGPAIKNGEIVPFFQPIVDLTNGGVAGFEVLARWLHPTKGLIPPVDFISLAEKNGLIDELLFTVLKRACLDMKSLPSDLTIGINVSPCQIQDQRLPHRILATLNRAQFSPSRLEVELTESALVSDMEAAKSVVMSLKGLGIRVALDDFGTGYSSLSYLSDLPFDKIKIDRSFIKTVHDRRESLKIVGAIIGLGRSLGAAIVAEGIETERDEVALQSMHCSLAQGYLYSKPVPAEELPALLQRLSGRRRVLKAVSVA
jgi:diguanylate cyclase (GGDEF)-like protein